MSHFTRPADVRLLAYDRWQVLSSFEYHLGHLSSARVIRVASATIIDLRMLPRWLWMLLPLHGRGYAKALIVYGYLRQQQALPTYAEQVFAEALKVLCQSAWQRRLLCWAVRQYGRKQHG